MLSCGRDPRPYEALGYPVATDQHPGDGPLGGIVSALPQVETEWILTHPGDTPFPDASLVERLAPVGATPNVSLSLGGAGTGYTIALAAPVAFAAYGFVPVTGNANFGVGQFLLVNGTLPASGTVGFAGVQYGGLTYGYVYASLNAVNRAGADPNLNIYFAAIGVEDPVLECGGFAIGLFNDQHLIKTDAIVAVGPMSDQFGARLKILVDRIDNGKIVTETVHLRKSQFHGNRDSPRIRSAKLSLSRTQ